ASGAAPLIALQRSAGNSSTVALLRRTREESPITLTIPGVVDRAAVSSWSLGGNPHPSDLSVMRPTDSDSPRLFRAVTDGATGTATLVVRKLTPLGWVHQLTMTLEGCTVSSYQPGENDESVGLTFTGMQVEQ
ncbi:MAG TPA: type VI secretion system tube protein Hcp, partial [Solirubrobacteraceae bacterium]|nr:type VI secretion system tube protein Hcp [Solirubrobacteraceae bacterium]